MSLEALIEAIHASPVRLSLCICGAGAGAVARLTQVAECSRTLLEADVLYHRASTRIALDGLPKHLVSIEAARRLAQHAFNVSRTVATAEARVKTPSKEKAHQRGSYLFGIGATSAVKTSRARRSGDQVFVSVWGGAVLPHTFDAHALEQDTMEEAVGGVFDYHMHMPDSLDRAGQDKQVELMVLHAIADTVARTSRAGPTSLLHSLLPVSSKGSTSTSMDGAAAEKPTRLCAVPALSGPHRISLDTAHEMAEAIQAVLSYHPAPGKPEDVCVLWNRYGELRWAEHLPYDGEWNELEVSTPTEAHSSAPATVEAMRPLRLLYPGSFNPLHYGHTELVQAAIRVLRQQPSYQHDPYVPVQVTYEIAVKVVDKGAIACRDLQRRVAQFLERGERVAVTNATLFISKASLFPGHGFLIGIDTAVRVVDPQYYSTSTDPHEAEAAMVAALQRDIGDRGCYFVVGGRQMSDTTGWQDLTTLSIPAAIRHLFVGISDEEFRVDISSTELRAKKRARLHPHPEAHSNM
ncbi:hypothetical protein ABB37_08641 [Leptomonas pyrrhocoris]|uniref:Cytidyltransferase-like domain-containing protein n=1 Tax=Leptomonas pyrrhocoris TaxID=157538 RepID=A0A0N1J4D0_LEPPY|nr:hypothetical protein ABB37_08641 [Leptomonas pyrrhocoris]KPA75352.1 hypothetical protein ABB37_08641 [Leptomonas pyrrhocoris]|eukprot:XP_015653791.1 hypothetical protein ABB37_08641 [Leptomonas pyrrhocoris]